MARIAIATILVLILASAPLILAAVRGDNEHTAEDAVEVPDVIGMPREDAERILKEAGLDLGEVRSEYSALVEQGRVISTEPSAGWPVVKGTPVNLVISAAPGTISIPDVSGKSAEEAQALLQSVGFAVEAVEEASESAPAGMCIRSEPPAGEQLQPGSSVRLVISSKRADGGGQASNLVACPTCGGAGRVGCPSCGGSGVVVTYSQATCHNCGGRGWARCSVCGGNGSRPDGSPCPYCVLGQVACPACGGSGTVRVSNKVSCPNCGGSGRVVCSGCHGSGKVAR